jgi:Skp family chaperone for outer membrane proteins
MKRQVNVKCDENPTKKVKENDVTNNTHDNKVTSNTSTNAEIKARRAEYQRKYRKLVTKQQQLQQQQEDVTPNDKATTSKTLTEAERKIRHAQQQQWNYKKRVKEQQQLKQQQQEGVFRLYNTFVLDIPLTSSIFTFVLASIFLASIKGCFCLRL